MSEPCELYNESCRVYGCSGNKEVEETKSFAMNEEGKRMGCSILENLSVGRRLHETKFFEEISGGLL